MASGSEYEYHIGGVRVKFPVKAYPTQMAMMSKIIQALNHKDNALLESPTGSGKSLALLCSALAWQRQEYLKIAQEETKGDKKKDFDATMACVCKCHGNVQATPTPVKTRQSKRVTIDLTNSPNTSFQNLTPANSSSTQLQANLTLAGLTPVAPLGVPPNPFTLTSMQYLSQLFVKSASQVSSLPTPATSQASSNTSANNSTEQSTEATRPSEAIKRPNASDKENIDQLDGSSRPPTSSKKRATNQTRPDDKDDIATKDEQNSKSISEGQSRHSEAKVIERKDRGDDDDDGDFKKSSKRFRTPSAAEPGKKRRKVKKKGVYYEDAPDSTGSSKVAIASSQPQWKLEFPGGSVPGLGISGSQIMDSGLPTLEVKTESAQRSTNEPKPLVHSNQFPLNVSGVDTTMKPCPKCIGSSTSKATEPSKPDRRIKAPKIYFATRTHRQIAQITHELARTAYSETHMCILASREHTCIHPEVSTSRNKNEECKKKLEGIESEYCSFFTNVNKKLSSQAQLQQYGLHSAWDIEDLVSLGKKIRTCPYYASRGLMEEADIVFCPYNYLIDPLIRYQMLLEIENKVIILDEAHNMEDSARDAASLSVTNLQLTDVSKEINKIKEQLGVPQYQELRQSYLQLEAFCVAVLRWIQVTSDKLPSRGYEQAYGIWSGVDFLPVLEQSFGITMTTLPMYRAHLGAIFEANADKEQKEKTPSISVNSLNLFESMFTIMSYLFKDEQRFLQDYRMSLIKGMTTVAAESGLWMSRKRRSKAAEKIWVYTLNFWCLNPAVAFSDITAARSIILTSGTLSPMSSFSSELGVAFPITFEANHVIPETQTWIRSISHGPSGRSLIANYQNTETFEFQDELGEVILRVCQTVPYGVLCFFSSYKMMEKLTTRWQDTGLWHKILREKLIVSEPRSGHKEDFESAMSSFYNIIDESSPQRTTASGEACQTGALFLAVCRGKVSEGLDFANNNARAVITVGIPFPSIKDKQVELKREYNNEHCRSRGLLTGSEWYEIQAYRALNQALGRCIRHKKDWGALVLVDERYSKGPHYTKGLSKWVRQRITHQKDFQQSLHSLRTFTEHRMRADEGDTSVCTLSVSDPDGPTTSCQHSPSLGVSMSSPHHPSPLSTSIPTAPLITNGNPLISNSTPLTSTPTRAAPHTHFLSPHTTSSTGHTLASTVHCDEGTVGSSPAANTSLLGNLSSPRAVGLSEITPNRAASHISLNVAPSASKPLAKSKITDFVRSTQGDNMRSRFEYPGRHKMAANASMSPSQLQTPSCQKDQNISLTVIEPMENAMATVQSEASTIALSDSLEEPDTTPEATVDVPVNKHSETLLNALLNTIREESPLLFDTPSVGNQEPLALKLAKRAIPMVPQNSSTNSTIKAAGSSNCMADHCHTRKAHRNEERQLKLSPSKPEDSVPMETTNIAINEHMVDDKDATPPLSHQEAQTPQSRTLKVLTLSTNKKDYKTEGAGSPLGKPRVKRTNTRLASKKRGESRRQEKLEVISSRKGAMDDKLREDTDFSKEELSSVCCSSCGQTLATGPAECLELKNCLCRSHKVIRSSKLWHHLTGNKPNRQSLSTLATPTDHCSCLCIEGEGDYNAVWDEQLALSYSLVQCPCGRQVGVVIHAASDVEHPLLNKTLLARDQVQLHTD